jgi:hypothetical protein
MNTTLELNTSKLREIFQKIQALPSNSGGSANGLFATMKIPANQSIVPEVTAYINDVTMEGETV